MHDDVRKMISQSAREEEKRVGTAMVLRSSVLTVSMAAATIGLTWWLSGRWVEGSGAKLSPVDVFAFVFYLLDVVAAIRLVCFAGMLLSADRRDEAIELMPAISLERHLFRRSRSPSSSECKRIGIAVLIEAAALCVVWIFCVYRVMHLH
jgi:hypothetical protein